MKDFTVLTNAHPQFIENLYHQYLQDANSVSADYQQFFQGFDFALQGANGTAAQTNNTSIQGIDKEFAVYSLIRAYQAKGHLIATTNPIRQRKDRQANLECAFFGLTDADLPKPFAAGACIQMPQATLSQIIDRLKKNYTGNVGFEYSYITNPAKLEWLQTRIEQSFNNPLPLQKQKRILEKLNQGVIFEKFLQTKYIGQKRFSLEGGETTIPALDAILNTAGSGGVQEVQIGMAHRGRLNVLANILGKTYEQIFSEFEGIIPADASMSSGDVKYHLGYIAEHITTEGKKVNLQLCPNPSHLELVNPVVQGFARSKAELLYKGDYKKILPILIHGDGAVAGQGIVYELQQMSKLKGYTVGGTIHLVINNQIGFTTDFEDARSSDYCTSYAAMTQSPVFHVNGDDAEAVVKCAELATEYRQTFGDDVFIDMVCYRKHGHNEGDEPKFTQPALYALIDKHLNPRETYTQWLIQNGESDAQQMAADMEKKFWSDLQERFDEVKQKNLTYTIQKPEQWWRNMQKPTLKNFDTSPSTAVSEAVLKDIFAKIMQWPSNFNVLKKIEKLLTDKTKLFATEQKIDWATGELLAYATLLTEGKEVRMSGEDVQRGTFSHRHAVLIDEYTNQEYNRLNNLAKKQEHFKIFNSLLSELAVLGFEYGYSMANPNALVIWEAQYGDFSNGAQAIIDQYIASGEQKWNKMNGLVLFLPHGYEGAGPEHSSARPERFLQLCGNENMIITNITTAANFFHALRRQLAWNFRKPLVNFTPKANLRHVGSYSHIHEFTQSNFKELIDDTEAVAKNIKKVLLCTGKIYFELNERKLADQRTDVAVVRLEQIYPTPTQQLQALQKKYSKATWHWVQEEPYNMGAAQFLQTNLTTLPFTVISRPASGSTASGYNKIHLQEQKQLIDRAYEK